MKQVKYNYEDINRDITLICDIDDVEPYHFQLPEPPKAEFIGNFGLKKEEQFFQKERIPVKIWQINKALNSGEITRKQAFALVQKDSELREFVASQWRKREYGEWQYIYGKAYFLTPTYWFFLNYYQMDLSGRVGTPSYRVTQWEKSLWWKFCVEENKKSYGGVEFTRRRDGKSYWAGNILVEAATKTANAYCGIQSKNEDDANALFNKAVLFQVKRIPFYFLPEHERFSKQSKKVEFTSDDIETTFESSIDYKSTTATAYDGQKLFRWVGDEFGKMEKPANPVEIWDKNQYCFFDDGKVIGKGFITSTVEEMTRGGGEEFHRLVHHSSRIPKHGMVDEFGRTDTRLEIYFTSAYKNMFADQYGIPIIDEPLPHQKDWRKKKGDEFWNIGGKRFVDSEISTAKSAIDRQSRIRKMPPTFKDAFRYNNTGCLFDIDIINNRLMYFSNGYPDDYRMTFGYFSWVPGKEYKEAVFNATDEKTARCHIRMLPLPEMRNKWYLKNGKQYPSNFMWFNMGGDPFKLETSKVVRKDRMSDGAGHVFAFTNPNIDPVGKPPELCYTNNFVLEYLYRAATPDLYAEDMAMIAVYYGCKIFPEANILIVDDHFRKHGLGEYLQHRWKPKQVGNIVNFVEDKKIAGAYTSESLMPSLVRHGINYVKERAMWCPFYRTLEQLRDLQWNTLSENDAAASALYCLFGAFDKPQLDKPKTPKFDYGRDIGVPSITYMKN